LAVGLCFGLFGEPEMIGFLVKKVQLTLLTLYFFVAFGWILGPFDRKRRKKRWWSEEANSSER
jgi:hypothetical protein